MPNRLSSLGRTLISVVCLAVSAITGWCQPTVTIISSAPVGMVSPGQSMTLKVSAQGSGLAYQWTLGGMNVTGAMSSTYQVNMLGALDRGTYQVVVTGSGGSTTVDMGTLSIGATDAKLSNLSARAGVGTGDNVMIAGFVSQGDASSTNKNIMLRGMGPAMSGMGGMMGTTMLSTPVITVYDSHSSPMVSNVGWMSAPVLATGSGSSSVQANARMATSSMMTAMGAFLPANGSADSALVMTPPLGTCTAILKDLNNMNGLGLVECYDADAVLNNAGNTARMVNMSARAHVGAGSSVLIAGCVIGSGPAGLPETVLLRAMGPALSELGIGGVLSNPTMTLYDNNSLPIASNSGWTNMPVMASGSGASPRQVNIKAATSNMMSSVGAFLPAPNSADCAMVATLSPGAYTVIVSGMPDNMGRATTGVCLAEVYEIR